MLAIDERATYVDADDAPLFHYYYARAIAPRYAIFAARFALSLKITRPCWRAFPLTLPPRRGRGGGMARRGAAAARRRARAAARGGGARRRARAAAAYGARAMARHGARRRYIWRVGRWGQEKIRPCKINDIHIQSGMPVAVFRTHKLNQRVVTATTIIMSRSGDAKVLRPSGINPQPRGSGHTAVYGSTSGTQALSKMNIRDLVRHRLKRG